MSQEKWFRKCRGVYEFGDFVLLKIRGNWLAQEYLSGGGARDLFWATSLIRAKRQLKTLGHDVPLS